jgi:hypothetical protein
MTGDIEGCLLVAKQRGRHGSCGHIPHTHSDGTSCLRDHPDLSRQELHPPHTTVSEPAHPVRCRVRRATIVEQETESRRILNCKARAETQIGSNRVRRITHQHGRPTTPDRMVKFVEIMVERWHGLQGCDDLSRLPVQFGHPALEDRQIIRWG